MIFTPTEERLWDTWMVEHEGVFHLFYLRISKNGKRWDGISVATSTDLIHFEEAGPVIEKLPERNWLGTGSVTRVGPKWIMNFSEEIPGSPHEQVINFAESDHLTHGWKRMDDVLFRADPRYYEHVNMPIAERTPRWDSIGVAHFPDRDGPPFLGYFTADALHAKRGAPGCVGLAESDDAVHWRCLPPALAPGLFSNCEVVEHCQFGPRHYLMFASNTAAGFRHDKRSPCHSGGTYYVIGDAPEGPFVPPPTDPLLQGSRSGRNIFELYVGRPFRHTDGTLLFSHHWASRNRPPSGSWGPAKTLIEIEPWRLGLGWWPGNENLKAESIAEGVTPDTLSPMDPLGELPVCRFSADDGDVRAEEDGGCWAADWRLTPEQAEPSAANGRSAGRVLEVGIRVDRGVALGPWFGTMPIDGWVDGPVPGMGPRGRDFRLAVLLNAAHQRIEFVRLMHSIGTSLIVQEHVESIGWTIARGITHQMRSLVRSEFIEVYLDNRYVSGASIAEGFDTTRVGFVSDRANGVFRTPRLWRMG